jgi:hypothetical protein
MRDAHGAHLIARQAMDSRAPVLAGTWQIAPSRRAGFAYRSFAQMPIFYAAPVMLGISRCNSAG